MASRGPYQQRQQRGRSQSFNEDASRPKVSLHEVQKLVDEATSAKDRKKARLNQIIALGARPTRQQRGNINLKMLQGMRKSEDRRSKRREEEARQAGIVLPSSSSSAFSASRGSPHGAANVPNLKKRKRDMPTPSKWSQLRGDRAGISGTVADPDSRRALKPHIGRYHEGVVSIAPYQINRVKRTKVNS
jgi:hypothetical protein